LKTKKNNNTLCCKANYKYTLAQKVKLLRLFVDIFKSFSDLYAFGTNQK